MPYYFEKLKIRLPKGKDRRVKLTDDNKAEIEMLYKQGTAIREIARRFVGICSRRMIQFIIDPKRLQQARLNYNWKKYYNKEKHRKVMTEHRHYKKEVLKVINS